ncbi:hypothetical protein FOL47_001602 [Perkinsus chesapeaki]|uniref:Protein phosphatase n=1 Tax=Perkinsus chesapeaki TaxID=330153 RepID=A0A7J6MI50_PERCH|nr:hypothetical protein FOL47_001602 [Perkinsus chesapeaki]
MAAAASFVFGSLSHVAVASSLLRGGSGIRLGLCRRAAAFSTLLRKDSSFRFDSSRVVVPHRSKKRGEDASFNSDLYLGVADGVGGWILEGVDSGEYSRLLMHRVCNEIKAYEGALLRDESGTRERCPSPVMAMTRAARHIDLLGSSTCLLCFLDPDTGIMHTANVGDSAWMVYRPGTSLGYRSKEQTFAFNAPYQLDRNQRMSSPLRLAERSKTHLQDGDMVVVASDGLWDNVFDKDVIRVLERHRNDVQAAAMELATDAVRNGRNKTYASPFFRNAIQQRTFVGLGGKEDDVTVIVGRLTRTSEPSNAGKYGTNFTENGALFQLSISTKPISAAAIRGIPGLTARGISTAARRLTASGSAQSFYQFRASRIVIPNFRKEIGEDASFHSNLYIGVVDGVGGKNMPGLDPARYSRALVQNIVGEITHYEEECLAHQPSANHRSVAASLAYPTPDPQKVMARAASRTTDILGSATCLLGFLSPLTGVLNTCNIGDSCFIVYRPNEQKVLFRSKEQLRAFNFPYQIGPATPDLPLQSGIVKNIQLKEGDTVVFATDGLWDNLYDEDVCEIVQGSKDNVKLACSTLAETAYWNSRDKEYFSPFSSRAAKFFGHRIHIGGKVDDISIIVAEVERKGLSDAADREPPAHSYRTEMPVLAQCLGQGNVGRLGEALWQCAMRWNVESRA